MTVDAALPTPLPAGRILGVATEDRRRMLACIDVVVGYVSARHRFALAGWRIEAALVESRPEFRGGETVALRAHPLDGRSPADLPPVPVGVLREIGSRCCDALDGIASVVPDIACTPPDVEGASIFADVEDGWGGDARIA